MCFIAFVKISVIVFTGFIYAQEQRNTNVCNVLVIDTFSSCLSMQSNIPCGWYATQKDINMFSINEENGNKYLKIKSSGGSTTIGMRYEIEVDRFRYLSWRWRVHKLPVKGREDRRRYSDSAAGVYVIFNGRMRMNRIIKYVWSSTLQPGVITESPFNRRTKIMVLRSGKSAVGWVEEVVDVYEDYKRIFGGEPPGVEGIAVMSDSDNTQSDVEADYDDFRISVVR